jgi:hypothetical protein
LAVIEMPETGSMTPSAMPFAPEIIKPDPAAQKTACASMRIGYVLRTASRRGSRNRQTVKSVKIETMISRSPSRFRCPEGVA